MKSSGPRQLRFVFADNPQGSEAEPKADASAGRSYLLLEANRNLTIETDAPTSADDASHGRLLERVASMPNLARAFFDAHIRRRLRALLVCQKKRPRHLYRHLLPCGISPGMAKKSAYEIRGHWKRSASFGVHKAYSNAWFAERLVQLRVRWQDFQPTGAPKQLMLFEIPT